MSLEAQRSRIEGWTEATNSRLVGVLEDAGVSGSSPLALRPNGSEVASLLDQREPDVDAVVITRLDRLGRDASETLGYLHRFARGKVGLVSILDRLDLSTPQGRAMAGVAAVFGQLERELIGQRTAEALSELRNQGRVYGPVPFGYLRKGDTLVPDDQEQSVIKQILAMRYREKSYRAIASWLNAEAIPAKRGGEWSAMSVRSVQLTACRSGSTSAGI